jgi:hypothetical protein
LNTPYEKLLKDIIKHADAGEHTEFRFLRTWHEYTVMRRACRMIRRIIKGLQWSVNKRFSKYCEMLTTGEAQFTDLIICNSLKDVINFYEEELNIITDMLDEYTVYLSYGNYISSILFLETRPDESLWDHRGS